MTNSMPSETKPIPALAVRASILLQADASVTALSIDASQKVTWVLSGVTYSLLASNV